MSLTAEELASVVSELAPLVGGTLQKLWSPTPRTVVFELRVPGATHLLLVSTEPDEARLHLATTRPPSPPVPHALQNLLRSQLLPAKLVALDMVRGDRVVILRFETPEGARAIVAELFGRRGELFLLGADEKILGAAPGPVTDPARRTGARYVPPTSTATPKQKAPRFPEKSADFALSQAIEAAYGPKSLERELAARRREALRPVRAARKRIAGAIDKLTTERANAAKAEELGARADVLKTVLAQVPRGARTFCATAYTEEGVRQIELLLEPHLSPRENLARLYKQARRLLVAREKIAERLVTLTQKEVALAALAAEIERAQSETELAALASRAAQLGARARLQGTKDEPARKTPYRVFRAAQGQPIWVGKGARQNDELTFRLAKGNDLWLHARGVPGSHVLVPSPRGAVLAEDALLDACALAIHFSQARGEALAEVAVTFARYVRRSKGAAPGAVTYSQERVIAYRSEETRLMRLLATEAAA